MFNCVLSHYIVLGTSLVGPNRVYSICFVNRKHHIWMDANRTNVGCCRSHVVLPSVSYLAFSLFALKQILLFRYLKKVYFVPISWTFMFVWLTWLNFNRTNWFTPSWALNVSGPVMLMLIKYTFFFVFERFGP